VKEEQTRRLSSRVGWTCLATDGDTHSHASKIKPIWRKQNKIETLLYKWGIWGSLIGKVSGCVIARRLLQTF
jgi:hypothetical protein